MRVLELGASAGLNLNWDRFRYERSAAAFGPPDSPVRLPLAGTPPPALRIVARRGCDAAPLDPGDRRRSADPARLSVAGSDTAPGAARRRAHDSGAGRGPRRRARLALGAAGRAARRRRDSRGVTTHGFAVNVDNDLDAVRAGCARCWRPCRATADAPLGLAADGAASARLARARPRRAPRSRCGRARTSACSDTPGSTACRYGSIPSRRELRPAPARLHVTRSRANPGRHGRHEGPRAPTRSRSAAASRRGSRSRRPAAASTASSRA